jgi:hypothetical protein
VVVSCGLLEGGGRYEGTKFAKVGLTAWIKLENMWSFAGMPRSGKTNKYSKVSSQAAVFPGIVQQSRFQDTAGDGEAPVESTLLWA